MFVYVCVHPCLCAHMHVIGWLDHLTQCTKEVSILFSCTVLYPHSPPKPSSPPCSLRRRGPLGDILEGAVCTWELDC